MMFQTSSKLRGGRITLEPYELAAYYGFDGSDVEDTTERSCTPLTEKTVTESMTVPSFHCTVPGSPFESTYFDSFSQTQLQSQRKSSVTSCKISNPSYSQPDIMSQNSTSVMYGTPLSNGIQQSVIKESEVVNDDCTLTCAPVLPDADLNSELCSSSETESAPADSLPPSSEMELATSSHNINSLSTVKDLHASSISTTNIMPNVSMKSMKVESVESREDVQQPSEVPEYTTTGLLNDKAVTSHVNEESDDFHRHSVIKSSIPLKKRPQSQQFHAKPSLSNASAIGWLRRASTAAQALPSWRQPFSAFSTHRSTIGHRILAEPLIDDSSSNSTSVSSKRSLTPSLPNVQCLVPRLVTAQSVGLPARRVEDLDCSYGTVHNENALTDQDVEMKSITETDFETEDLSVGDDGDCSTRVSSKRSLSPTLAKVSCILPNFIGMQNVKNVESRPLVDDYNTSSDEASIETIQASPYYVTDASKQKISIGQASTKETSEIDTVAQTLTGKTLKPAVKRPQHFSRTSIALREIVYNYATPTSAPRVSRRKSVTFKQHDWLDVSSEGLGLYDGNVPRHSLSASGRKEIDEMASPSSKQILLCRRSSISLSKCSVVSNQSTTASVLTVSSGGSAKKSASKDELVVGSLDDGSFTTLQSRDSFFSNISDLSPIKNPKRLANPSDRRRSTITVTSSPSIRSVTTNNKSPLLPRGNSSHSYAFNDSYGLDNLSNDEDLFHNLSQEIGNMEIGNENLTPPDDLNTTPVSAMNVSRRSCRKFFDQSMFTTGANDSSLHIHDPLPGDNDFDDEVGSDDFGDMTCQTDTLDCTGCSTAMASRRQSCASCGPSRTHIVAKYDKKAQPSPIFVYPAPKIEKQKENVFLPEQGLRRSTRIRLPRLNALQQPIYERDADGNFNLKGVTDVVVHDKLLKKHRVTSHVVAMDKEQEMKRRKRLEQARRKEQKARLHQ